MNKWIRIEERLPNEDDTGFKHSIVCYIPELERDENFPGHPVIISNREYASIKENGVTHWMPLPEPPNQTK